MRILTGYLQFGVQTFVKTNYGKFGPTVVGTFGGS